MVKLEEMLDREVGEYLGKVEAMDEVKALLSGEISREDYIRFLKTFYIIEFISRKAVLRAAKNTEETNPYLSARFISCARGEEGHAEIALEDLAGMGADGVDMSLIPLAGQYGEFLLDEAGRSPLGVLGHSYLFENASGIMFPRHSKPPYPSRFIEVHAKEDPSHSIAIKKTVRMIEPELTAGQKEEIVRFARESGDYLLRVFESIGS
jgi:hypothetical protein